MFRNSRLCVPRGADAHPLTCGNAVSNRSHEGGWVDTARWLASNRPSSAAHDGSGSRTHGSDRGFGLLFGAWGWWGKTRAGNVRCAACPFWGPCLSYVRAATVGVFPPRVRHFVGISRSVKDVLRGDVSPGPAAGSSTRRRKNHVHRFIKRASDAPENCMKCRTCRRCYTIVHRVWSSVRGRVVLQAQPCRAPW